MSQSVFQPIGQKRLTNIAVVRYKKHGKRFEIACYKNKVVNWRNGIERDLDEVLQTTAIFSNVSKGVLAKKEDLMLVFGTDDAAKISIKILAEGELQVSDKERKLELDTLFRDVAGILSDKCINPKSKKPYTIGVLERALKDIHFSVDPKRPAKTQAFEALPLLQQRFPIERAQMHLKIHVPTASSSVLHALLSNLKATITEQNLEDYIVAVDCYIDPGSYREIHRFVQDECEGGRVDVISLAAFSETEDSEDATDKLHHLAIGEIKAASIRTEPESTHVAMQAPKVAPKSVSDVTILYPQGVISNIPEQYASRRDRFMEIDNLEPGWTVQLQTRGPDAPVDAIFFSPSGEVMKTFAAARRKALSVKQQLT